MAYTVCLIRSIKAYLCPNMINFTALDFSERRSEEVIYKFLLTSSVVVSLHDLYSCVDGSLSVQADHCTAYMYMMTIDNMNGFS